MIFHKPISGVDCALPSTVIVLELLRNVFGRAELTASLMTRRHRNSQFRKNCMYVHCTSCCLRCFFSFYAKIDRIKLIDCAANQLLTTTIVGLLVQQPAATKEFDDHYVNWLRRFAIESQTHRWPWFMPSTFSSFRSHLSILASLSDLQSHLSLFHNKCFSFHFVSYWTSNWLRIGFIGVVER